MRRVGKLVCIVTVCFMILTTLSGCGLLQKLGLQKGGNDEATPVSSIVMNEEEAEAIADKVPVHLYFANAENTKLKLQVRYLSISDIKKVSKNETETSHLAGLIVKELIKGPDEGSGLKATIPDGTTLKSVKVKSGVATIDLSKEFVDKHPGGEMAEKLTLYSVVNSLTELKDVETVKFTIDGKTREKFKENFLLNAPFPRMTSLISTSANLPSASSDKKTDTKTKDSDTKNTGDKAKSSDTNSKDSTTKKTTDDKKSESDSDTQIGEPASQIEDDAEGVYLDTLSEDTLE